MKRHSILLLSLLLAALLALPAHGEAARPDLLIGFSDVPVANEDTDTGALTLPEETYPAPLTPEWLERQNRVQGTGSVADPEKYWDSQGWPDDVSYAFCAGGMVENGNIYDFWEIGLVDADEARRAELISLAGPNCLLTFYDCQYSLSQRQTVRDSILAMEDPNIQAVILGRNTEFVFVDVGNDPKLQQTYQDSFSQQFGGLVLVSDLILTATENLISPIPILPEIGGSMDGAIPPGSPASSQHFPSLWLFMVILLAAILWLSRFVLRKHPAAIQTMDGTAVSSTPQLSRSQVEQSVREHPCTPAVSTFTRIKSRLS